MGTVSQSKGVIVMRPPEIVTFTAEPAQIAPGTQVILSWHTVLGRGRMLINDQPVAAPDGSVSTAPTTTTEYVLTAKASWARSQHHRERYPAHSLSREKDRSHVESHHPTT